jgi:hypothetical protein
MKTLVMTTLVVLSTQASAGFIELLPYKNQELIRQACVMHANEAGRMYARFQQGLPAHEETKMPSMEIADMVAVEVKRGMDTGAIVRSTAAERIGYAVCLDWFENLIAQGLKK